MFHFRTLLKPQNLLHNTHKHRSLPSIILLRTLASSPKHKPITQNYQSKWPLHLLFQEAVGLRGKTETDIEIGGESNESNEVRKKLWALEREVKVLKEASSKVGRRIENAKRKKGGEGPIKSLHALFIQKKEKEVEMKGKEVEVKGKKEEKPNKSLYALYAGKSAQKVEMKRKEQEKVAIVLKELSPNMKMFVSHLYKEGYFNEANFLRGDKLDFSCFDDIYARNFVKSAAEKFGEDHQHIAKWLSGSHLKKVALFGCPSLANKDVFAAKMLRNFFKIQEDTVCNKCVLKPSCKFVNRSVEKSNDKVFLLNVARVITLYALELVHPELSVPNEIKVSVSKLLNEVLKLSQTTCLSANC